MNLEKEILAYSLQNALEFGKADPGKVLPKLFQHGLKKEDIKKVMPEIQKIVKKVNSLSKEEREKEFHKLSKVVKKHEEKEKDLPEIKVPSKVVTRIAPEPSKYNHIGHAMSFLLNYLYAKKYHGKCLLRFEDTNPEKVSQEYVDAMMSDVIDYLDIKVDKIRYISDDMQMLYDYAEELIKKDKAFMCNCSRDKMQELRHSGKECSCRKKSEKQNSSEWKDFLNGKFKGKDATLRFKGDMQNDNHVLRDPVIFRFLDAEHYRHKKKYKVWPMYDFYNPIEDSTMGVTLILRSNEFEQRVPLQNEIKKILKLANQEIVQYGRFNVMDYTTKGREVRELVESGELIGWDDPRLVTLRALKRRGIVKETYYELAKQVGLSKHPVNLTFDMIAAINRKIIDSKADRYSFVANPVELVPDKLNIKSVKIPIHPDKDKTRTIKISNIFVSQEDFNQLKGKETRLLHLCNLILNKKAKFTSVENKDIPKINWVSEGLVTRILMPTGEWTEGLAEESISKLKPGDIIQFERFGFVRFDNFNKSKNLYEFWFAHK